MTLLPDLEAQLRDAARRTQAPASRAAHARRTLRPRRRMLLIALAVVLAIASAAVAAIRITTGADAPRVTSLGSPYLGPGRVLHGQSHAIDARAGDPDGGPRWGLRAYRTSRGGACWQVGRVLDGRLGVLGRDGLLGDDGRFHALPLQVDRCRPLDGAGHLFVFQNALAQENGVADRQTCRPATLPPDDRRLPLCPAGSTRLLLYGYLGPLLRSVTLTLRGTTQTVRAGRNGAFLFALKLRDVTDPLHYDLRATYADGTRRPVDDVVPVESVPDPEPARPRPPGYVDPLADLPSPARLRAPLHVTVDRWGPGNTVYKLAFRAPVALRRFGVEYSVLVDGPAHGQGRTCTDPMSFAGFNTDRNVRAGQRIAVTLTPGIAIRWNRGWCPGRYRVTVVLHDRAHPVGSFTFRAP